RLEQHDGADLDLVMARHRLADLGDDAGRVTIPLVSLNLLDDDQLLLAIGLDRERGSAGWPQRRMAALDRPLQVVRVVVAAADHDEILDPPRDVELAVPHESEIARAQVRSGSGVGEPSAERPLGLLRSAPVSARDARAGHPDLADAFGRA